ncbi:hypothetical protein [Nocardia cyriacigeorgica]|uniref:hypothetical protein n=1 Tax=Nocardia cyriacigeorgica TaxID=135487 RepID=UPI0013D04A34|nr:hypothetical protein [Nocardia cyriacigeorgica]NEW27020.1 hypothetical protein [Nocardia cyriacigeorgica]
MSEDVPYDTAARDSPVARRAASDFGTALGLGLDMALVLLDDSDPSSRRVMARLERAAARCAREQVPLEAIQHVIHDSVKTGLGLGDPGRRRLGFGMGGSDECLIVDLLDTLTSAVSRAYVAQLRSAPGSL